MSQGKSIFVFGSNLAGRHGAGSAKEALDNHGAIYGQGFGLQGNSFAIPTKDHSLKTMSIEKIECFVNAFIKCAKGNPSWTFNVVKIGCGLAGYKEHEISPLFEDAPSNVNLPEGWRK